MLNAGCFCFATNKSGVVVCLYNIFTASAAERSSESKRQARDQEDEEENDANAVNRGLLKHPQRLALQQFFLLQKRTKQGWWKSIRWTSSGAARLKGAKKKPRASDSRQQKHDKRDALLLVQLLAEDSVSRNLRAFAGTEGQSLIHRYKLVRIRAQVKNGLQHLAMNQRGDEEVRVVEQLGVERGLMWPAPSSNPPEKRRALAGKPAPQGNRNIRWLTASRWCRRTWSA